MKNSIMKKLLALLVCVIMAVGVLPMAALAEALPYGKAEETKSPAIPTDGWIQISGAQTVTGYKLVNSFTAGKKYQILASNQVTDSVATLGISTSSGSLVAISTDIGVTDIGGEKFVTYEGDIDALSAANNVWLYTTEGYLNNTHSSYSSYYLYQSRTNTSSFTVSDSYACKFTYNNCVYNSTRGYYMIFNGSSFAAADSVSSNNTYIYEYGDWTISTEYAAMSGKTTYVLQNSSSLTDAAIKEMIRANLNVWVSNVADQAHADAQLTEDYSFSGSVTPGTNGTYTLDVIYGGVSIGSIKVYIVDNAAPTVSVTPSGSVALGADSSALVGSTMYINYTIDGETVSETVDVTFGMVTPPAGQTFSDAGLYTGCTVTYNSIDGRTVTYANYTLNIYSLDYPDYPEPGAISVNKTASGIDWFNTGLANVELSAKGVPSNKGVDIVIIVDTSTSMNSTVGTTGKTRIEVLRESLVKLVNTLSTPNVSGELPDVNVAIADFNGHSTNTNSSFAYEATNRFADDIDMSSNLSYCPGNVYTGPNAGTSNDQAEGEGHFNAAAFVPVSSLVGNDFSSIQVETGRGTNYDAGLGYAYLLAKAKKAQNDANHDERDIVVIFMSDGAPHQFNFFVKAYWNEPGWNYSSWQAANTNWRNFITGSGTSILYSESNSLYMNGNNGNKHWYAEAIKGNSKSEYSIVDMSSDHHTAGTDNVHIVGDEHMFNVNGLGAELYTIGFGLSEDDQIELTVDNQKKVLSRLSSGDGYSYSADSASELTEAFESIVGKVLTAAKYAYYEDTMGEAFELQTGDHGTNKQTIQVKRYTVVRKSDVGKTFTIGGSSVTLTAENIDSYVGQRIDGIDPVVIETVTFKTDGSEAYSDQIGSGTTNIIENDVIVAKYFRYNLSGSAKEITVPIMDTTIVTDVPDKQYPYTMRSYSFSTNPFNEGWTQENSSSVSDSGWKFNTDYYEIRSASYSSGVFTPDARLYTPEIVVPKAGGSFIIDAVFYSNANGTYGDQLDFYIQEKVGESWITGEKYYTYVMTADNYETYTPVTIDLVGYENKTVRIMMHHNVGYGYGVSVDNAFFYGYNFATAQSGATETKQLAPYTFYWIIGDITEDEIALSYNVYLKNSILDNNQTGVADGIYPTNTEATLHYTNYLDTKCMKDTVSPELPWGSAVVRYAFYYVDESGKPIINLVSGQTGSFANRIAAVDPTQYQKFRFGSTVNINASELAEAYGLTLYDAASAYSVTAGSGMSDGSWSITKGTDKAATTYVTGYSGSNFSNSTTATGANCSNTTVWFAVVYRVGARDDTIVVDYGLPVTVNVLENDLLSMINDKAIAGVASEDERPKAEGTLLGSTTGVALASGFGTEKQGTYGKAVVTDNARGTIRYQLNKTTENGKPVLMNGVETLAYAVRCPYVDLTGATVDTYYYANLTIIPATTVYYEDSFVNYSEEWTVPDNNENPEQAQDRPGYNSNPQLDANNLYGYDPIYDDELAFSMNGYHKVTVNEATDSRNPPSASFTFKGTGFDVISKTDSTSGLMIVQVENSSGGLVKSLIVDTYYGYTYNNGIWTAVPSEGTPGVWQVPVIKVSDLAYGEYTVTIKVIYNSSFNHTGSDSYTVYLDAIRIYDPAKGDATAEAAYKSDGEANPDFVRFRDFVFSRSGVQNGTTYTFTGAIFIDGMGEVTAPAEGYSFNYLNPSPNNEIYLTPGQGVYFRLMTDKDPSNARFMIGTKLAFGDSGKLALSQKNVSTYVTDPWIELTLVNDLSTTADMYYELKNISWSTTTINGKTYYVSSDLMFSNPATKGTSSVISITNIKVTSNDGVKFVTTTDSSADPNALLQENENSIVACCDVRGIEAAVEHLDYLYGDYTIGDVNGDGNVNTFDALLVMRYALGLVELKGSKLKAADFNGDGTVSSYDALVLMRHVLGAD